MTSLGPRARQRRRDGVGRLGGQAQQRLLAGDTVGRQRVRLLEGNHAALQVVVVDEAGARGTAVEITQALAQPADVTASHPRGETRGGEGGSLPERHEVAVPEPLHLGKRQRELTLADSDRRGIVPEDRKSTRLNSSHGYIS